MAYLLGMLNSNVNPALYALVSEKFRTACRNFLKRAGDRLFFAPALHPGKQTGQFTQNALKTLNEGVEQKSMV